MKNRFKKIANETSATEIYIKWCFHHFFKRELPDAVIKSATRNPSFNVDAFTIFQNVMYYDYMYEECTPWYLYTHAKVYNR